MTTSFNKKQQSGIALVISLIMLLLLTIIGVTAMRVTGLEEKMAGNSKDQNVAFQAAEISLRDSEAWLDAQVLEPTPVSNPSLPARVWTFNSMDPIQNSISWWQEPTRDKTWWEGGATVQYGTAIPPVSTRPYSVIELKQYVSDTLLLGTANAQAGLSYYQVTARGTGGSDLSKVLLQSTIIRRY